MCRFLSLDFEYTLKCPVDKQTTRSGFRPSRSCVDMRWMWSSVTRNLKSTSSPAAKHAVLLLESGEYWQRIYPESATFIHSQ